MARCVQLPTRALAVSVLLLAAGCAGQTPDVTSPRSTPSTAAPRVGGAGGPVAGTAPDGVVAFEVRSRSHVAGDVNYPQIPPVGGDHAPVWQNCGVYSQPISEERAVHALEHGAVWITYRPSIPAPDKTALKELATGQTHVLVTPWPDETLPSPIVASSWGTQLELDTLDRARLVGYLRAYVEGPATPEPGAPCDRGQGKPE